MDKHTWKLVAGGHELAVTRLASGDIKATWGALNMGASAEQALGKEVLRLAERVRELEGLLSWSGETNGRQVQELAEEVCSRGARIAALEAERETNRAAAVQAATDRIREVSAMQDRARALEKSLAIARRGEEHEAEQRDLANQKLAALEEENRRLRDEARLSAVLREYLDWSLAQFPHSTPASVAAHIMKEAGELRDAPDSAEELADLLALVVHSAARQGIDLAATLGEKLPRLRAREWQAPDADGVVEHVRSERTDLRGFVVWHRHDGDLVKLVPVSEAEEFTGAISVSYNARNPS